MSTADAILNEVKLFQEYASIIQHGDEDTLAEIHLAEIHCIDAIGKLDQANVTKIADLMRMTRGAISKINKKLLQKKLIVSYQSSKNQKEIYYDLTIAGKRIYDIHTKCHLEISKKKLNIINTYSLQEQQIILQFLSNLNLLSLECEKGRKCREVII